MALRERGDHSLMRLYYMKRRCEEYTADVEELELGAELTWQFLLGRSQKCTWGPSIHTTDKGSPDGYLYSRHAAEPPEGAEFCCAGIDVQNNRVYPVLVAGARDNTTWDVAWSYQYARADHMPWDQGELHRTLDAVLLWLQASASNLPLVFVGVDTGDFTKDLYSWIQSKRGGTVRAIKGTAENMKPHPGDVEGILYARDSLLHINSDSTRELVHSAYRRPNGTPGAAHIPNNLNNLASDRAYLQHLVAEMKTVDAKTRRTRIRQGPGRWDWLDARRIAYALTRLHLSRLNRPPPTSQRFGFVGTIEGGM